MALAPLPRRVRPDPLTWHPTDPRRPAGQTGGPTERDRRELTVASALVASGAATRVVVVGLGAGAAALAGSIEAQLPVSIESLPNPSLGRLDVEIRSRAADPGDV